MCNIEKYLHPSKDTAKGTNYGINQFNQLTKLFTIELSESRELAQVPTPELYSSSPASSMSRTGTMIP